jgi:hypothetical protein
MLSNTLRTTPDGSLIPYYTIWWRLIGFWAGLFKTTGFGLVPDRTKRTAHLCIEAWMLSESCWVSAGKPQAGCGTLLPSMHFRLPGSLFCSPL